MGPAIRVGSALLGFGAASLLLAAACRPVDLRMAGVAAWAEGPVSWLALPEERHAASRIRDPGEWARFVEAFWARRPRMAPIFAERVAAADRLYSESGVRGSLTDRGGALILLGPPGRLRVGETTVPSARRREGRTRAQTLPMEVWIYPRHELEPGMTALLEPELAQVELVFLAEGRRTRLVEGRDILVLAARSWIDSEVRGFAANRRGESPIPRRPQRRAPS